MYRKLLLPAYVGFSVGVATFAGIQSHRKEAEKANCDIHELQRANRGLGEIVSQSDCPTDQKPCSTVTQKVKGYRVVG